jgi:hypothetical protein
MRPAVSGQDKTSYAEDLKRQMLEKKRFSLSPSLPLSLSLSLSLCVCVCVCGVCVWWVGVVSKCVIAS